jgi:hypothetical protein
MTFGVNLLGTLFGDTTDLGDLVSDYAYVGSIPSQS